MVVVKLKKRVDEAKKDEIPEELLYITNDIAYEFYFDGFIKNEAKFSKKHGKWAVAVELSKFEDIVEELVKKLVRESGSEIELNKLQLAKLVFESITSLVFRRGFPIATKKAFKTEYQYAGVTKENNPIMLFKVNKYGDFAKNNKDVVKEVDEADSFDQITAKYSLKEELDDSFGGFGVLYTDSDLAFAESKMIG